MKRSALTPPQIDPTLIFELYRNRYASELLTAAVAHFNLFGILAPAPLSFHELRRQLGLQERPAIVVTTALRAMQLLEADPQGRLSLTPVAQEHLVPGAPFDVSDYVRLSSDDAGVAEMVERLKTNRPAGSEQEEGAAWIFRSGMESAMEKEATARHFTLALAGRAKNVAPVMAERMRLDRARLLLDVGGGTGIYSIALLQKWPNLRAIIWDRPEVLKVATEMAEQYGVADRVECVAGDMFADPMPGEPDVILLSNILHDWDVPECQRIVARCADALSPEGQLLIHDVFLNDALDGPLPIALYSAALFSFTEGRAYSAAEYRSWFTAAGLVPGEIIPTLIHCGVLPAMKSRTV